MFTQYFPENCTGTISDTGQLIVWGDNKHGQLAMDPDLKPVQHEPVIVPEHLFEKEKIVQVYSGWTHMLALTGDGSNFIIIQSYVGSTHS